MRAAVRTAFVPFTSTFEGVCSWMYLDVKGLVTTAIGNLIDLSMNEGIAAPWAPALPLPFMKPNGEQASLEDIEAEWQMVKSRTDLATHGGYAYKAITRLRLSPAGIDQVVGRKLAQNDAYVRAQFGGYEDWPADAQLGTMSMAWACGAYFANEFPHLTAALKARDFATASIECEINSVGNPGIVPRNKANRILFMNAFRSQQLELDPDRLWYPRELTDEPPTDVFGMTLLDPPLPLGDDEDK